MVYNYIKLSFWTAVFTVDIAAVILVQTGHFFEYVLLIT